MVGDRIGHYRILDKLGEGGMGVVYRAHDESLNRTVALKVLPRDLTFNQERLGRFRREAEVLAALDHPNIVTVYSIEEVEGTLFFTMQLVEGESLDRLIPAGGLPIERLLEIAVGVADGLVAAHKGGVIHRDLKPANVMLDAERRVKLLDFGLAKLRSGDGAGDLGGLPTAMSRSGQVLGTLPYMAPEQVRGPAVDHRADLFSFGVVLYAMVTGRRPFEGGSPAAIAAALMRDDPVPATELRRDLPRVLVDLLDRCLKKEREARVQTAAEVRDALRRLQSGLAVNGVGIGWPDFSWLRPRRAVLGALVAAVLSAVALTLWRSPGAAPKSANDGTGWKNSVVVLPFVNMSGDPLPGMAMVHYSRGIRADSDRALSEFIEKYQTGGAYNVAQVYAFRGEADEAFQWLERAYAQHDGGMFLVKVDPLLENLRTDSRFEAVLRKLHLSAQASESRHRSRSPGSPDNSSRTSG